MLYINDLKVKRAFLIAADSGYVHYGPETMKHILENVNKGTNGDILRTLSSKQLAQVFIASSVSFREGDLLGRRRDGTRDFA